MRLVSSSHFIWRYAVLAAGVAATVLLGCGSGAPTKREYIEEADKVCKSAQSELRGSTAPLEAALQRGGTPSQVFPRVASGLATAERAAAEQVDKLSALRRPAGKAGQDAAEYIKAVRRNLALIGALRKAGQKVDLRGFQRAGKELGSAGQRTSRLAAEFGFEVCGRTGG
jgi:hypothetical protein